MTEPKLSDEEIQRRAKEAEENIAKGRVKVNQKNHVQRYKRGEDDEDRSLSNALDELDAVDDMFRGVLK